MTLYTELGIKENATREEIRSAYLRLAKAVHPDKAQSESERVKAEGVMSRLNQIMVILGDDEKRKEYDAALKQQRDEVDTAIQQALALQVRAGRVRGVWGGWSSRMWFAGLMLLVAAAGGVVWFSDVKETQWWSDASLNRSASPTEASEKERPAPAPENSQPRTIPPAAPEVTPEPEPPAPRASQPVERIGKYGESALVQEARRVLRTSKEKPKIAAPAPAPPSAPENTPAPAERTQVNVAKLEVPPPPPPAPAIIPETVRREVLTQWGGVWRYMPGKDGGLGGPFTPVAIEMRLQENGASVRGVYKASYEGTGKKYSPDVVFSLTGQTEGNQVHGEWTGEEGARGGFEMKRLESRTVQVSWWTTALGRKPSLASGVARLIASAQ